jgi:hypothetical protein
VTEYTLSFQWVDTSGDYGTPPEIVVEILSAGLIPGKLTTLQQTLGKLAKPEIMNEPGDVDVTEYLNPTLQSTSEDAWGNENHLGIVVSYDIDQFRNVKYVRRPGVQLRCFHSNV